MQNQTFTEQLIIKSMLEDKRYLSLCHKAFEKEFFTFKESEYIYESIINHFNEYKEIPNFDIIKGATNNAELKTDLEEFKKDLDSIEFDIPKNFDYLVSESEKWMKYKALEIAIIDSAQIVKGKNEDEYSRVRENIEAALSKNIINSLGTQYFEEMSTRLQRMFTYTDDKIPSYYPTLDEFTNGGFPLKTLSVIAAGPHCGKSIFLANCAARMALHGHDVVLYTLEMAETMFSQRIDSIYSNLDINRIYDTKKNELVSKLKEVKNKQNKGEIFIKEFPTGAASVNDLRVHMHELKIRGKKPKAVFVDYLNLLRSTQNISADSMYMNIKKIGEELRAFAIEFEVALIVPTQLNRTGQEATSMDELSMTQLSESSGTSMIADFIMILGIDIDAQVYEQELHYKIVKNRFGGRVGETSKFYLDSRSLHLYDLIELEQWQEDAKTSNGNTELK